MTLYTKQITEQNTTKFGEFMCQIRLVAIVHRKLQEIVKWRYHVEKEMLYQ